MKQSAVLLGGAATFKWTQTWGAQTSAPDVAIVGAGLAGLACADALAAKGVSATVYEARDRLGGRVFSIAPDGFPFQVVERGGELIDFRQMTMRGYAREFNLTLEPVIQSPGMPVWFLNGQMYTQAEVDAELKEFVREIEPDLDDLGKPTAVRYTETERILDVMSLADYLVSHTASPLVNGLIDTAYNIEYGAAIEEQSALTFLLYLNKARQQRFPEFGVFSDEKYHLVGGNQGIVAGLAARLLLPVNYEHRLMKVSRLSDGRIELVFDVGGKAVTTRHDVAVLTMPFSVLRDVELDSSLQLPPWKSAVIKDFRYGNTAPMHFVFNGRPWEGYGGNGQLFSNLPNCQHTWATEVSLPPRRVPLLVNYTGGNLALSLNPDNVQEDAASFLEDFDTVFPSASQFARRTVEGDLLVHLEHWPSDQFAKGSYTCNQPGYFTTIAGLEAVPVGNLLFAGEHTDSFYDWQGFMEGACNSGIAVAKQIVRMGKLANQ